MQCRDNLRCRREARSLAGGQHKPGGPDPGYQCGVEAPGRVEIRRYHRRHGRRWMLATGKGSLRVLACKALRRAFPCRRSTKVRGHRDQWARPGTKEFLEMELNALRWRRLRRTRQACWQSRV